jgi:hypothetical protein
MVGAQNPYLGCAGEFDGARCAISQRPEMIELDAAFKQSRTFPIKKLYASGTHRDDYRLVICISTLFPIYYQQI